MLTHQARQAYHAAIALGLDAFELLGSADECGAATGEDGDVLEHLLAAVAEAVNGLPYSLLLRAFFMTISILLKNNRMDKMSLQNHKMLIFNTITLRPFGDPSAVSRQSVYVLKSHAHLA